MELAWHRFHPVTPFIKGWKITLALLGVFAFQASDDTENLRRALEYLGWGGVAVVVLAVLLVGTGYAVLAWRMARYAIGAESVHLRTGVLFRQSRSARLDRIQAIDVVQPLLARMFGLAELKIEVAGGANSAVRMSFLPELAAQELRNQLLARAAGLEVSEQAPEAPEQQLFAVTPQRLIGSLLRSGVTLAAFVVLVTMVVALVVTRQFAVLFAFWGALPVFAYLFQRFASDFNFRAATSPDGIRLRHGLLETRAQTVPPGRVQAVRMVQGPLWRGKDWWRVQMNVAGYGLGQSQQTETVLLPVGSRDEALLALWLVLPELGTSHPQAVLYAAMSGTEEGAGFVTDPPRAKWLDPFTWRRNGFRVTDRALLLRRGRFVRSVVVVPHERTQSLGLTQGPLQRRLGLVSFALHSTPGPVVATVPHLDERVGADLLHDQSERARRARRVAGPEQWMAGNGS